MRDHIGNLNERRVDESTSPRIITPSIDVSTISPGVVMRLGIGIGSDMAGAVFSPNTPVVVNLTAEESVLFRTRYLFVLHDKNLTVQHYG